MKTASSFIAFVAAATVAASASANLRITEVMSSSGTNGTSDWFEVTNYGSSSMSITGWKMDDGSFNLAAAVALSGISSIGAGETVIFMESAAGAGVAAFSAFWGSGSTQVGFYSGSGVGLSSGGDGVCLFDTVGALTTQVSFGAATTGSSFFYGYDAAGAVDASYNGLISSVGTIGTQVTGVSVDSVGNVGSIGTAIGTVPSPAACALLGLCGLVARRRR
jgi:MYXO-CTERM domain-containing protein